MNCMFGANLPSAHSDYRLVDELIQLGLYILNTNETLACHNLHRQVDIANRLHSKSLDISCKAD